MAGVEVSLIAVTRGCPSSQALTDERGRFQFDKIPHGAYCVAVFKIGYEKITYGQTKDHPVGQELIVTPTSNPPDLEILLPYGAGVAGHIYDPSGLAIPRCYVFFDPVGITNQAFHVMTDQNGYYWAASLPEGAYVISARKYSEARHQVEGDRWYYPRTVDEKQATAVSLAAGKTATIDIRFGEDRVVKWIGTVLDPKGMPVARADLEITKWDGMQFLSKNVCRTGPKGTCEDRDLTDGNYWIFLSRAPYP